MSVRCHNCEGTHQTPAESWACHKASGVFDNHPTEQHKAEDAAIREATLPQVRPFDTQEKELQRLKRVSYPTDSEATLWERLRDRRLDGFAFHREFKIRGWVVDFYCPAGRLVVEVDGSVHKNSRTRDEIRDQVLRANWYKVRRIDAALIESSLETAVQLIADDLDNPTARNRRGKYGLPGQSRIYEVPPEPREPLGGGVKSSPRNRPRSGAPKRSFVCQACKHPFVAPMRPNPRCFECDSETHLVMVCSKCGRQLLPRDLDWGLCADCRIDDAHLTAVQAAGPGAQGPDGFQLQQSRKGKMWKGR